MKVQTQYAGFWRRFAANIIDGAIINVIISLLLVILTISALYYVAAIVSIIYIVGFWVFCSQTPGKMAMDIKIVNTDGSPISFRTAILRFIGNMVSAIVLYAGFFMVAWDGKKQGLHDKIASTYVINTK